MSLRHRLARVLAVLARWYVRYAPGRLGKTVLSRHLVEPVLRRHPHAFRARTLDGFRLGGTTRDLIQRYVYVFGVWEPDLTGFLRDRLRPGDTVVDVGANVGYFTLLASRLVGPQGRVVAIEALPATYAELAANLELNGTGNVRTLNVAASDRVDVLTLYGGEPHNSGTTTTVASVGLAPVARIDAAPLAELLTAEELRDARVVKIDVEGAEPAVVRGLEPLLLDGRADLELVLEVSPAEPDGDDPEAIFELLGRYGFAPYRLDNDYRLVRYVDRRRRRPPHRFVGPVTERVDLVFSRVDAGVLP